MDISFFRENGYQVIRNIIPHELIESERNFLEKRLEIVLQKIKTEIPFQSLDSLIKTYTEMHQDSKSLESLSPEIQSLVSGHFDLETRLAPELRQIPLLNIVHTLFKNLYPNQKIFMHMPPTARFILPQNPFAGVPAHQDISYNHHLSDFIVMWCPLVPTDSLCGGVLIHQGTQHLTEQHVNVKEKFWLEGLADQGYKKISYEMSPGDILLLNPWIVHESMPNNSNRIRYSIDHRFFSEQVSSSKHGLDLDCGDIISPTK